MKALLFLVVIAVGVWLWRNRQNSAGRSVPPPAPAKPLDMVRCVQCGLHVGLTEAVQGKQGPYCCDEHLRQSEP